jgi:hypothetical protein
MRKYFNTSELLVPIPVSRPEAVGINSIYPKDGILYAIGIIVIKRLTSAS